jgi:hypothetical protein
MIQKTFLMILCCATASWAQFNTGDISGVVADVTGAVLPGVDIVAIHTESGLEVRRVTDGAGHYLLPSLPAGAYRVDAELPGFRRATSNVLLTIGQTADLDLELEVGIVSDEVTVIATTAPLLQSTTSEISDVLENATIIEMPLNGRQLMQLAQLSDSVVIPPGGTRGAALQQAGPLPSVGGQRAGHNIYLLDGVKVTDELFNNLVINPSVDSIQEFKIQKSMYPAEFGGKASALINVATKAGTNNFHGSLFGFVRNDRFDARNYFDDPNQKVPPLRESQFGFSFGGPVKEGRTFFFTSYERQTTRRSITKTFSVPTLAMRNGDFGSQIICDPFALTSEPCAPFAGNRIPGARIDPVAQAFLSSVPLPTGAGPVQNLRSIEKQIKDAGQFSARMDHRFRERDTFFARFSTFDADEVQPFGTSVQNEDLVPGFGRELSTTSRNLALGHTHTFGVSVLNELRFGWLSVSGGQVSENLGVDFAGPAGLQGVTAKPEDVGFPQISTSGQFSTMGDPTSFVSRENEHFEVYDNILIDRGRHKIKFGGYWFHLKFQPKNAQTARGSFRYTGQWTGNALADFMLGYPTSAEVGIGSGSEDARTDWAHVYIQDDWAVRSNLTFNVGFRYEINTHMEEVDNRLSTIDLSIPGGQVVIASDDQDQISSAAGALLGAIPIPWVTSNQIGWDPSLLRPSYRRFAPRIGLAWTFGDLNRSVLRAGYGVFLNQWAYSVQTSLTRNLPFFQLKRVDIPIDQQVPTLNTASILQTDSTGRLGGSIMDHAFRTEYTQTWSLGLQHEISSNTVVEGFYMGSRTVGADNSTIRNVPEPGPGSIDERRPIPALSGIRAIRWDGNSIYHALTLKVDRKVGDGLSFSANYTLSKSIDDASSPGATASESNVPQDVRNVFGGERALSSFDHRHLFSGSGSYRLDFLNGHGGWSEALAGNWQVSSIVRLESGAPFTVNLGVDQANVGSGPAQRPNVSGNPNLRSGRKPEQWFDTSVFSMPNPFTFGNSGRNTVFAPGYGVVDVSAKKSVPLLESAILEFRWEIFNVFNRANFDVPGRIAFSRNFGRIFSAKSPREMQFGIRLQF